MEEKRKDYYKAYNKKYYLEHREQVLAKNNKWNKEHKDNIKKGVQMFRIRKTQKLNEILLKILDTTNVSDIIEYENGKYTNKITGKQQTIRKIVRLFYDYSFNIELSEEDRNFLNEIYKKAITPDKRLFY